MILHNILLKVIFFLRNLKKTVHFLMMIKDPLMNLLFFQNMIHDTKYNRDLRFFIKCLQCAVLMYDYILPLKTK